jgi:hypothetical protein
MAWYHDVVSMQSSLKWYRSWPIVVPEGRAYVQDGLPRLLMSDCDYNTVEGGWPDDEPGFCMLEWDVALDIKQRSGFAALAEETPEKPLVAPYIKNYRDACVQIHRRMGFIPIEDGTPQTDYFGFGCIYLPRARVAEYKAAMAHHSAEVQGQWCPKFNDTTFSQWHWQTHGPVDVTWDFHPQHLHGD